MGQTTPCRCFIWHTTVCFVVFCFLTSLACQYFKQEPLHVSTSIPKNERTWQPWLDSVTAAVAGAEKQLPGAHTLSTPSLPCAHLVWLSQCSFWQNPQTFDFNSSVFFSSLLQRKHSELWDRMDAKNTEEAQETEQPACWTFGNRTVTRRSGGAGLSKA